MTVKRKPRLNRFICSARILFTSREPDRHTDTQTYRQINKHIDTHSQTDKLQLKYNPSAKGGVKSLHRHRWMESWKLDSDFLFFQKSCTWLKPIIDSLLIEQSTTQVKFTLLRSLAYWNLSLTHCQLNSQRLKSNSLCSEILPIETYHRLIANWTVNDSSQIPFAQKSCLLKPIIDSLLIE